MASVAIGYMFHQNLDVFPVIGGSKVKYFRQALEAVELPLTQEEAAWLDLRGEEKAD